MRQADRLEQYVREALGAGRSRDEISQALSEANWTPNEVRGALEAWGDTKLGPPIPRPRPSVSAKEAFFYGLMFAALAMTSWHLVALSFNLIDIRFTDPLANANEYGVVYRQDRIRWSIAALIVFAPLFVFLNARTFRATREDPGKRRSAVRRWFAYITLFLAAVSLLGNLLWVVYSFLDGSLGIRVALKAGVVLIVAGAIFLYFRSESWMGDDAE